MFPEEPYRSSDAQLFTGAQREQLYHGLRDTFDDSSMRTLLGFSDFDSWDNSFDGSFDSKLFALIDYLRMMGQLHWLVFLAQRNRPGYELFTTLRGLATPPLPPTDAPWPPAPAPPPPAVPPGAGPASQAQPVDPWQTVLLQSGRPFLDRGNLRENSRLVGLGNARPILSVAGPRDTGKSYSARYLVDVAKASPVEQAIVTKEIVLDRLNGVVETGASADIGGLRLARRLATDLTDQPFPPHVETGFGSEQDTTWAADVANWIVSMAVESPVRWLVLDGFENTVLSPSAQALIDSLLSEVARVGRIRVALLGYTGSLSWCADFVRTVGLDLNDFADPGILRGHVLEFLVEVRRVAALRARPAYTDNQLLEDAGNVLSKVDPAAPNLHALEASLTDVAERVLVGP